jgi:DNA processing protein
VHEKLKEYFRLEQVKLLTDASIIRMLGKYDTAEECRELSDDELCIFGVSKSAIRNLRQGSFSDDKFNKQMDLLETFAGVVSIVTVFDDDYPENLKNIYDPPPLLYYEGTISAQDNISIAVVGSRSLSRSGIYTVNRLSRELSQAGFVIISGLAMGADTVAHIGALESGKRTVSVLGSGIDKEVNASSRRTRKRIVEEGGAVFSQFPIGTEATNYTFPARNRIISGLSLGVVIGEAKKDSGSLITANFALEQGKEVFAIPNEIYNLKYEGGNNLIKTGQAKLIMNVEDIIEEFPDRIKNRLAAGYIKSGEEKNVLTFSDETEEKIYNMLIEKKMNIDEISDQTGLDTGLLMGKLFMMEMNKLISREPNNYFSIARK